MRFLSIKCNACGKKIFKSIGRINEAKKMGWKQYCSRACQAIILTTRQAVLCSNPKCGKEFKRQPSDMRSKENYCSRSCAVTINNVKYPKRFAVIKNCISCSKDFKVRGNQICCSIKCSVENRIISDEELVSKIRKFYKEFGRIPLKREFEHYSAMRGHFGSWNKAIEAAGLTPNSVRFSEKHIAGDGHKCDSMSEKIIDDWLFEKSIAHQRSVRYPENKLLTADFVIGNKWIEFFGLAGDLEEYDRLVEKKRKLSKKNNLRLIEIYPKDIFPKKRRDQFLAGILK